MPRRLGQGPPGLRPGREGHHHHRPQGVVTEAYDPNTSKPGTLTRNGTVLALAGYSGHRLATVTYANTTGLSVGYDLLGRQNSLSFTGAAGRLVAHQVTTSLGGRRNNQLIDTAGPGLVDPNPAGDDLVYDGAGRLTTAFLNGARADYGYAANLPGEACANPNMGADTNRTAVTTTPTTGPATVNRSCYDKADRLVSTTSGGPVSTAYAYDDHGNATVDGATTLTYDAADRLSGVASATATVSYVRDALDRVVSRTEGTTVTNYAYAGFSDSPVAVLDGTGALTQATVPFPGGVTLTVQATGDIWSYPDLAGHLIATTNAAGTRQGTPVTYDPWGAEYPVRPPVDNATATPTTPPSAPPPNSKSTPPPPPSSSWAPAPTPIGSGVLAAVGGLGCTILSAVLKPQISQALGNVGDRYLVITVGFGFLTGPTASTSYVAPIRC